VGVFLTVKLATFTYTVKLYIIIKSLLKLMKIIIYTLRTWENHIRRYLLAVSIRDRFRDIRHE